ncbi:MAG TPA: hypothetical protein VNU71_18420 [Burkholderiaceae bacterium]|nr:hypothetical protein [Burkholderiaceae bacterium]
MSALHRILRAAAHWGGAALALAGAVSVHAADLTPTEQRWLQGAWPLVTYAKSIGMPLDIVVQPQDSPQAAPLAMAFIDGRCKLVLSMRGNPQATDTLRDTEPELLDATLELMAAHELGHCHRYLEGAWFQKPAGFEAGADAPRGAAAARREEGYGDLVGLAWIRAHHPELYGRLHAWLLNERETDHTPGSAHDTVAWVRLARDPASLGAGSLFDAPRDLWARGGRTSGERGALTD